MTYRGPFPAEYAAWRDMKSRCYNSNHQRFKYYGGRGIEVCVAWRESFANFIADMGPRPPGHSIEREKNNRDYGPENCVWATQKQQQRNTRANHNISFQGRSQSVAAWAEEKGLAVSTVKSRLIKGWSVGRALLTSGRSLARASP